MLRHFLHIIIYYSFASLTTVRSLVLQVTTVQLNDNTDRNWGTTALRQECPNGTLLRTFEQQQDKGEKENSPVNITISQYRKVLRLALRDTKLWK